MKEINVRRIEDAVASMCADIAVNCGSDIAQALEAAKEKEEGEMASAAMAMLVENIRIAREEQIPICQDTGLAIVWLEIGQDVHLVGGSLKDAVNKGVERGYTDNYLRASAVDDPLYERKNTKTNTPAVIYTDIVDGDEVKISLMAKGFGSENKSALKMLTPADGEQGVIDFVLETIEKAGGNACPPFVIGVGIGGTFDSCACLSKKALLRPLSQHNSDARYAALEQKLLDGANALNIGPMGFHGNTTALAVQIEQAATHIAGMPVAVNVCCHVCRHAKAVIA